MSEDTPMSEDTSIETADLAPEEASALGAALCRALLAALPSEGPPIPFTYRPHPWVDRLRDPHAGGEADAGKGGS